MLAYGMGMMGYQIHQLWKERTHKRYEHEAFYQCENVLPITNKYELHLNDHERPELCHITWQTLSVGMVQQ
jgi:hypothetical protein